MARRWGGGADHFRPGWRRPRKSHLHALIASRPWAGMGQLRPRWPRGPRHSPGASVPRRPSRAGPFTRQAFRVPHRACEPQWERTSVNSAGPSAFARGHRSIAKECPWLLKSHGPAGGKLLVPCGGAGCTAMVHLKNITPHYLPPHCYLPSVRQQLALLGCPLKLLGFPVPHIKIECTIKIHMSKSTSKSI